jgi:TetR/AcrR family transcriptional regulator, cholesterol catabolism regulator
MTVRGCSSRTPPSSVTAPTRPQPSSRYRLLETSADLFWSRGYRATTTRQIAAVLGLQQASLYHHVTSKEDLLYEICRTALDELLVAAETGTEGTADPLARVTRLVRASFRAQLRNQKTHATMAFELRSVSPARRGDLVETFTRYRELARSAIAAAQASGAVRPDIDARYLTLSLWNLMSWTLLWFRDGGDFTADQVADHMLDLWLRGAARDRAQAFDATPLNPAPDTGREALAAPAPSGRTADRVLDVAASLFRTKGYDATTAREIAAVLGIQKASLYHHTRGKGHLLHQVCSESLERIRQDVSSAVSGTVDPLERMRRLVFAHVSSLLRHQDQHATSLIELRALSGNDRATVETLREAHERFVRSVLEDGQHAGVLRTDVPAGFLALQLFSLTNRAMLWFRPDGPLSPDDLGHIFASLFLAGVESKPAVPRA